jgi:hypothetical protein
MSGNASPIVDDPRLGNNAVETLYLEVRPFTRFREAGSGAVSSWA